MDWPVLFLISIAILFFMIFLGEWIAFCLLLTGVAGLIIIGKTNTISSIGIFAWNTVTSFELVAIPLFILMGEIMVHGGLSKGFYQSAAKWLNRLPGGLLQSNIVSCAIFAAISGSSPATAAAIGSVAYPELISKGYDRRLVVGSLAGGGALGILIPPSINMMIYASVTEVPVSRLFIAGVIPGILCAVLFMFFVALMCIIYPSSSPHETHKYTLMEKIKGSAGLFSFLFLIVIVLGSIYTGWATTTEAAALGAMTAFLLSLGTRNLTFQKMKEALIATSKVSSMIIIIIFSAKMLSHFIAFSGVSVGVTQWIVSINPSKFMFFFFIIVMYLILGCILDGTAMLYLTMPVLLPILNKMNIDLMWFGIILILLTEIGMITPPVGINLYVIHSIMGAEDRNAFRDVIIGSVPFVLLYLLMTIIVILFPGLALWLPGGMR